MTPKIEVVVPAYNAEPYIAETLDSVLAQNRDVRIHVIDDGSMDGTASVVARYLNTGRVISQCRPHSDRGAPPRNMGLREVTAPYVAFFDADDVMYPGHLERQVALLDSHPHWVAVACDFVNFDSSGTYPQTQFASCRCLQQVFADHGRNALAPESVLELTTATARMIVAQESFFITGSVVFRTEVVRAIGGFDETLMASEDYDFFWRALDCGPLGVSTFCSFRRRLHAHNLSRGALRVLEGKVLSRHKALASEKDPKTQRALKDVMVRAMEELSVCQMPVDRRLGTRTLLKALCLGLPTGRLPLYGLKALAKSWIRGGAGSS